MVQENLANVGMHVGTWELNTQNEEWISVMSLYVEFYRCIFVYITGNYNTVIEKICQMYAIHN